MTPLWDFPHGIWLMRHRLTAGWGFVTSPEGPCCCPKGSGLAGLVLSNISFNDLEKDTGICSIWSHQAGVWSSQECFVRALNPIKINVLAMVKAGDGEMKSAGHSQGVKYEGEGMGSIYQSG